MDYFAHPSAVIDEPAQIGRGTRIWHFCHVMAGAAIGEDCNLGQNVFVAAGVRVGNGCKIQNNVSLYEGVELEDHVFCGPSVVFTNVRNPRAEVVRRGQYEATRVGRGATLGANSTVVCGTRIAPYAFIAAGAVVTGDVPAYALMAGVPARRIGWSGKSGARLLPVPGEPGVLRCPETGARYRLLDEQTLRPEDEDCGLRIADCGLSDCGLRIADCGLAECEVAPANADAIARNSQSEEISNPQSEQSSNPQSAIRNPQSNNPHSAFRNPHLANPQPAIPHSAFRIPHSNNPQSAIRNPQSDDVPLLDLKAQYETMAEEIDGALRRVVRSQHFILGGEVQAFEEEAARAIGTAHAIGCASGSDALLLALMALDLPPGSEVITTPYTFFATAGSIVRLGLKPVFCDIDPRTYLLDPARIADRITPRTRAIMPVHLFGQCAAMAEIMALAGEHGLAVIEDAAQAIGARDGGRAAGAIGTVGCFSFFPSKNLGGYGDGGLLALDDAALAARLRALRVHGARDRYIHEWVGLNSRLDALQAAVLRAKLPHLEGWCAARAAHAGQYVRLFQEAGLVQPPGEPPRPGRLILPEERPGQRHVYNQFVIRVAGELRDPLRGHLARRQIGTAVYYPLPLHLQPCFSGLGGRLGDFPAAEAAAAETLALPVYPELSPAQQNRVADAIAEFLIHNA